MAAHPIARPYIDTAAAAELLGMTPEQVRDGALAGRIPGTRRMDVPGGKWTFRRSDIEALRDGAPQATGQMDALVAALTAHTAVVARLCELIEERTDVRVPLSEVHRADVRALARQ
jgi:Helix-turn-helix domain